MKKNYKYFVSYNYSSSRQTGFGSIEMNLSIKIKSYKDVKAIIEWLNNSIKDEYNNKCKCIVLNYIPLEK